MSGDKTVIDADHMYRVALGAERGIGALHKFGFNPQVDAAEDIWDYGGDYNWLASADTLYASSSHAGDTMIIHVTGLDANWEEQAAIVTLNGQSQVEIGSGITWMRCFRAFNANDVDLQGDVYLAQQDTLTLGVPDTATKIVAMIRLADQQTLMSIYTVPAGKTMLLIHWHVTLEGSGNAFLNSPRAAKIAIQARLNPTGVFRTREKIGLITIGSTNYHRDWHYPIVLKAKTDVRIRCLATSAVNAAISGMFDGVLIDSLEAQH